MPYVGISDIPLSKDLTHLVLTDTVDLLQKSSGKLQVQVVEACQSVQSPAESPPSVSILLCQDSEHFQFPYDMLADHPSAGKGLVLLLLLRGPCSTPGASFSGSGYSDGISVCLDSLCLPSTRYVFLYGYFAPFEQFAVVLAAPADGDTYYLAALMRDDELGVLGMALFLPAVISPLFFCGRSTGLSPTSTRITANCVPSSRNFFLPGT